MITKQLKTNGLLLLITISIFACKKDEVSSKAKDVLSGAWAETPENTYCSQLFFGNDGYFALRLKDSTRTYWGRSLVGKYSISEDRLKVNITNEVETDLNGKMTSNASVNRTLFDDGKFTVNHTVLTIDYTTYPADAPMPTTKKYNKILAID